MFTFFQKILNVICSKYNGEGHYPNWNSNGTVHQEVISMPLSNMRIFANDVKYQGIIFNTTPSQNLLSEEITCNINLYGLFQTEIICSLMADALNIHAMQIWYAKFLKYVCVHLLASCKSFS